MKRSAPWFFVVLACLAAAVIALVQFRERAVPPARSAPPAPAAAQDADLPPEALREFEPQFPEAPEITPAPERSAIAAFRQPLPATGARIERGLRQFIRHEQKGAASQGRQAEVDPASFADLGSLRKDDVVRVPLLDGESVEGVVNLVAPDSAGWVRVGGALIGDKAGSFTLASNGVEAGALVQLTRERIAYEVAAQDNGRTTMKEKHLSEVLCLPLPPMFGEAPAQAFARSAQEAPPILDSRPAATAVIYLDFDGETVTDPNWNNGDTIVAAPANASNSDITIVFNRVKDDFWPFNITVTTDPARYAAAPVNRRTRCIVTPTNTAAPGAGGVAYLDSFSRAGGTFSSTIPCWVFNRSLVGMSEAISHEIGHTLGLNHDGRTTPQEAYYLGHGTGATGWCPIMGAGYYKPCVQWSKGEYTAANNREDDLQRITRTTNGFGYMPDDAGATQAEAATLNITNPNTGVIDQTGVIERTDDVDLYYFATNGGPINVNAIPASPSPNLDIDLKILDANLNIVAAGNPAPSLSASIANIVLPGGQYYVRVTSSGAPSPPDTGYSSYASLGHYRLSGSIQGFSQGIVITSPSAASSEVDEAFSYQVTTTGSPTSYGVTGSIPAGVSLDPGTGLISGIATQIGSFDVTMRASDGAVTATKPLRIEITPHVLSIGEAVNATQFTWLSTGSARWFGQTTTTHDGTDAAQSGALGSGQESVVSTEVTGPTVINFYWRFSAGQSSTALEFSLDDAVQAILRGRVDWVQRSVLVPAGTHTLRWRYARSSGFDAASDGAWIDEVAVDPRPFLISPLAVPARVGVPLTYQVDVTNLPATLSVANLPAWLSFDAGTGTLSGTPSAAGVVPVAIASENAAGSVDSTLSIHVDPPTPGSDLLIGATPLAGAWVHLKTSNTTATREIGEPNHASGGGEHSTWWSWTAPSDGNVVVSTEGSTFDTVLAVYAGSRVDALTLVTSNDDANKKKTHSEAGFFATAGATYRIAVDGKGPNGAGDIVLNIDYLDKATYAGLVYGSEDGKLAGLLSLKVTSKQSYSGSLMFAGKRYRVKGSLAPSSAVAQSVSARGGPAVALSLFSDTDTGTNAIDATLTSGGSEFNVSAVRAMSSGDIETRVISGYTLAMTPEIDLDANGEPPPGLPRGLGFAKISLNKKGAVKVIGTLGDGQKFSASGALDLNRSLPFFEVPYKKEAGMIGGNIQFDLEADQPTLLGNLRWEKAGGGSAYPAGFVLNTRASGARYDQPSPGVPVLNFEGDPGGGQLPGAGLVHFDGSDLVISPDTQNVRLTAQNKIESSGPLPGFKMKIDAKSGLFKGTVQAGGKKVEFSGAILQNENRGAGLFLGNRETGSVIFDEAAAP